MSRWRRWYPRSRSLARRRGWGYVHMLMRRHRIPVREMIVMGHAVRWVRSVMIHGWEHWMGHLLWLWAGLLKR